MPQNTELWDQEVVLASGLSITAGEQFDLLVSATINPGNYNSFKVNLDYEALLPADVLLTASLGCVVESQAASGAWSVIASQFSPLRKSTQPMNRQIVVQPNLVILDPGVDESVFPLDRETGRISKHNGKLPQLPIRVRIIGVENDPGGTNAWSSVTISGQLEQYDV